MATIGEAVQQALKTQPVSTAGSPTISLKFDGDQRKAPEGLADIDIAKCDQRLLEAIRNALERRVVPIYLFGNAGRGKSYAMAAAFMSWPGKSAVWHDVSQLLRKIIRCRMGEGFIHERRGSESFQVWESQIMERISESSIACFDDVGLRSPSDAMYDAWYEIVNSRKRKATIYTGNLAPEDLHKVYDARIASRMTEGTVIELAGPDRRLQGTSYVRIEGSK
jgi:predicted ATPase